MSSFLLLFYDPKIKMLNHIYARPHELEHYKFVGDKHHHRAFPSRSFVRRVNISLKGVASYFFIQVNVNLIEVFVVFAWKRILPSDLMERVNQKRLPLTFLEVILLNISFLKLVPLILYINGVFDDNPSLNVLKDQFFKLLLYAQVFVYSFV